MTTDTDQRRHKPSSIGDTVDELVISLINQQLDVQQIYNQTHRTRSSDPARSPSYC